MPNTIDFYRISVEEEHYFLKEHQNRVAFFSGLISAVIALMLGGFLKATTWFHFLILVPGGFLLAAVSLIAKNGTQRMYQRFLEAVTTRAKLEHDLGFSKSRGNQEGKWSQYLPGNAFIE